MAQTVDTLIVRIEADMKDMRRALRRVEADVSKSTSKMSGSFNKLGRVMKLAMGAVVLRQAFMMGKSMIDLASDIEEMEGKSKVVFGKFRTGVVADLTAFGDAVGRSTHELEGMASKVQDTFVPLGFARGEAAKLSVELTKLAVDTASFNNASDTATMEAFQSALVGNHETVRRFGVVITQATLDQELLTMGIEGGAKAATNAEKVQARLNLITSGVSDAQGDALRTADSYANSMRGLKAEFFELVGELGENFLPMLVKVIQKLRDVTIKVKEFLQSLGVIDTPLATQLKNTNAEIDKTIGEYDKLKTAIETVNEGRTESFEDTKFNHDRLDEMKLKIIALQAEAEKLQDLISVEDDSVPDTKPEDKPDEERDKQLASMVKLVENQKLLNQLSEMEIAAKISGKKADMDKFLMAQDYFKVISKFPKLHLDEVHEQVKQLMINRHINDEGQKKIDLLKAQQDEIEKTIEKEAELLKASQQRGFDLAVPNKQIFDDFHQQLADLKAAYDVGSISMQEYKQAMIEINNKILELDPAFVQMKDRIQSTADAMTDSLTQMVLDGKINFQSMKDMFKDMVRQMIADALKAQVIKPLIGGLFSGIGTAIGGPIGTAFSAVGAQATKAPGQAGGGRLQSGNPYLVGERGPELIVPSSAGTIMNNQNTKNAMGGGGGTVVNQTINVQSGVAQTVRAEMISLLPRFKQDTMNAVVDAKRRGGAFGQAFG